MDIAFYTSGSGRVPVQEFISSLAKRERAAVIEVIDAIKADGLSAAGVSFRQIEGKLWEIRIRTGVAVRILYVIVLGKENVSTMVLLHGHLKQSRRLPQAEKDLAIRRMKEVLE